MNRPSQPTHKSLPQDYSRSNWNNDDPATPALVDALLADMGAGKDDDPDSLIAVEATKRWCVSEIQFYTHLGEVLPMGSLNTSAWDFYHGYLACLKDNPRAR